MLDADFQPENAYDRLSWQLFRGDWAYRTVAVGDLPVACHNPAYVDGPHEGLEGLGHEKSLVSRTAFDDYHQPNRPVLPNRPVGEELEIQSSRRQSLDVWGLTGWFLNVFMWRMGYWRDVDDAGGKTLEVEQPCHASRL